MIDRDRLIGEFIEIVSVPCASKKEKQVADLVTKKLQSMGYEFEWDHVEKKTGGECGNIIVNLPATLGCEKKKGLFFEAHLDSVDPCTGTKVVRKDGVLYSDGTTVLGGDDKVGVVSMLEVLRSLKENPMPHGLIQMIFTVSEEIGCMGARYADLKMIKADYGYCLDSHGHLGEIVNCAPQQYVYSVTVMGKTAHGGVEPEKGINAIMLAAKAIAALPKYGRIDAETTLNVGLMNGGIATNIVADKCEFTIDMRSISSKKLDALRDKTLEIIKSQVKQGGGKLEYVLRDGCPGANVLAEHPCVKLAEQAAANLGAKPHLEQSGGCSDGNFYCGLGFPTVCLGTGMSNIHTTAEYLAEEDLYNTARWLEEIIRLSGK